MTCRAIEVCIVVDAGRFSATRMDSISEGWAIAMGRAAQSMALRLPVSAVLVSSEDINASTDPFAGIPTDERRSADAIMSKGKQLSQDRSASRIRADSPRAFVPALIGAISAASRLAPPHRRRIVAVYRQAFNYSGGSEENAIIEACARVRMERMTVLLIGRQVAGASSPSVQLCALSAETLQSAENVADHAWSLLERHVGLRRDVPAALPAWSVSHPTGDVTLMCDSCGSTRLDGRQGDHCGVCRMGHLHAVAASRPAAAVSPPWRSLSAGRAPTTPTRHSTPPSPAPARPVSASSEPASARATPATPTRPPAHPTPIASHPSHLGRTLALSLSSAGLSVLGVLVRLIARIVGLFVTLIILWAIARCMRG